MKNFLVLVRTKSKRIIALECISESFGHIEKKVYEQNEILLDHIEEILQITLQA